MELIATQRQRGYIAKLIRDWIYDIEKLEEIWKDIPLTNDKHRFGDSRELIIQDKLYGLSKEAARRIITALTKNVSEEEEDKAIQIIINKL